MEKNFITKITMNNEKDLLNLCVSNFEKYINSPSEENAQSSLLSFVSYQINKYNIGIINFEFNYDMPDFIRCNVEVFNDGQVPIIHLNAKVFIKEQDKLWTYLGIMAHEVDHLKNGQVLNKHKKSANQKLNVLNSCHLNKVYYALETIFPDIDSNFISYIANVFYIFNESEKSANLALINELEFFYKILSIKFTSDGKLDLIDKIQNYMESTYEDLKDFESTSMDKITYDEYYLAIKYFQDKFVRNVDAEHYNDNPYRLCYECTIQLFNNENAQKQLFNKAIIAKNHELAISVINNANYVYTKDDLRQVLNLLKEQNKGFVSSAICLSNISLSELMEQSLDVWDVNSIKYDLVENKNSDLISSDSLDKLSKFIKNLKNNKDEPTFKNNIKDSVKELNN